MTRTTRSYEWAVVGYRPESGGEVLGYFDTLAECNEVIGRFFEGGSGVCDVIDNRTGYRSYTRDSRTEAGR